MGEPYADRGCAHPSDRAGGPTDLRRIAAQPKALIPCAAIDLLRILAAALCLALGIFGAVASVQTGVGLWPLVGIHLFVACVLLHVILRGGRR